MKASAKTELEIISFKTAKEMEKWLATNHIVSKGIWLRIFKKKSGQQSITYNEALDEMLCCGWIDGQLQKYDDISWLRKFTPRGVKSTWSKRNAEHAERLIKVDKMKPSGLNEIEKAKADGRWMKAYDSPSEMKVPEDFLKALSKNKKAKKFFDSLNKANTYAIAWRLQTAGKPETREKRMNVILEMMKNEKKFH